MKKEPEMKKKNIYFCIRSKKRYFYPYEDMCIELYKENVFNRILVRICDLLDLPFPVFFLNKKIKEASKFIVTDMAFKKSVVKTLKNIVGSENVILYYMNNIGSMNKEQMDYFEQIYTFDIEDAVEWNIRFKHTPYSDKIHIDNNEEHLYYDTVFLGKAKNRIFEIKKIKSELDALGLNNRFMVFNADDIDLKINEYLDYSEYLKILSTSKAIVEVIEEGQSGCSLRYMEALFLRKLLITNNTHIIKDEYYNSQMVYIWGEDDRGLKDFIDDGKYYYNNDLTKVTFENWIQDF